MIQNYITEDEVREQQANLSVKFEKCQPLFNLLSAALNLQVPALIAVLSIILIAIISVIISPENIFFYIFITIDICFCISITSNKIIIPLINKLQKPFESQEIEIQNLQKLISKYVVLIKKLMKFLIEKQKETKNQILQISLLLILTVFSFSWSLKCLIAINLSFLFFTILIKSLLSNKQIKAKVDESFSASVNFIENKAKEGKQKIQEIVSKATQKEEKQEEIKEMEEEKPEEVKEVSDEKEEKKSDEKQSENDEN